MAEFLNFGSSIDGDLTIGSPTPWVPSTSFVSGSSGTNSVNTLAILAVSNGDFVFLHQLQGTSAEPELHQVVSGAGTTTLSLASPLTSNYSYAGTNRAMIMRVPQYGNGTINSSVYANAWNGTSGGYIVSCFNGTLVVNGGASFTATGSGFRGGTGGTGLTEIGQTGGTGESYPFVGTITNGSTSFGGTPTPAPTTNATAGAGGRGKTSNPSTSGGGGGSNTTAGTAGQDTAVGGAYPEVPGGPAGATTTTTLFGGGGGGGGKMKDPNGQGGGNGGAGGGLIYLYARNIVCSSGGIFANGADGENGRVPGAQTAGGGGGAGGIIKLWTTRGIFGTNKILAVGGAGGLGTDDSGDGGNGGNGKIVINSCEYTGTTNPTATATTGGFDFCSSVAFIM